MRLVLELLNKPMKQKEINLDTLLCVLRTCSNENNDCWDCPYEVGCLNAFDQKVNRRFSKGYVGDGQAI